MKQISFIIFLLASTVVYSIEKQFDLFVENEGNMSVYDMVLMTQFMENYLIIYPSAKVNEKWKISLLYLANDGEVIKNVHTGLVGFPSDVIVKEDKFRVLYFNFKSQLDPGISGWFGTAEFNSELELVDTNYSVDTTNTMRHISPKFYNYDIIHYSYYNPGKKKLCVKQYYNSGEIKREYEVGVFNWEPVGELFSSVLEPKDGGYFIVTRVNNTPSTNYLSIYKVDGEYKPLRKADFGKDGFWAIINWEYNKRDKITIGFRDKSNGIAKSSYHIEVLDTNLIKVATTDTIETKKYPKVASLENGDYIMVEDINDNHEYYIQSFNPEGKKKSRDLFAKGITDTSIYNNFSIQKLGNGEFFLTAENIYTGNDWDNETHPFGYRKLYLAKFSYPNSIAEELGNSGWLEITSNPANDQIRFEIPPVFGPANKVLVQVSDASGKLVHTVTLPNSAGHVMDVSALTPGMYLLVLISGDISIAGNFIISR